MDMGVLDEYYDQHAPTSRDRLAAKQAQQQAQADREGVPLETIRYREREAGKAAEQRAQRHRATQAAAALSAAQATLPSLDRFSPLARAAIERELTRREVDRQREEVEALAHTAVRHRQAAQTRQDAWESAYKREHGVWPSIEEMEVAGVLAPHWREKWAADDAAAAKAKAKR
jgi:hypothetical protein